MGTASEIELLRAEVRELVAFARALREELAEARAAAGLGRRLVCEECGVESLGDAAGWRMYLTDDGQLATYCGDCASAEFS